MLSRRQFALSGSALALGACAGSHPIPVTSYPPRTYRGYKGIAEIPYFELDARGTPVLKAEIREQLPWGIDFHTHFGHAMWFAPALDLLKPSEKTMYAIGCDDTPEPCQYNLNDYLNKIAGPEHLHEMEKRLLTGVLPGGSEASATHTIPNLLTEMDGNRMRYAVVLCVMARVPWRATQTLRWLEAIAGAEEPERFVLFGTLDPRNSSAIGELREWKKLGLKGIKLHPTQQHIAPDDPACMALYEECDALGISVFFHCGRAGIEPGYGQPFAELKNYMAPAREFPRVKFVFGHAGARDWREAMAVASMFDNVWLEIEGQGVYELQHILRDVGHRKMLFGSDWPFYPLAATVARVLVATEGNPEARDAILAHNGRQLLGL